MPERKLTSGEISFAKTVFGNSIDYSKVSIVSTDFLETKFPNATAPFGDIYYIESRFYSDDFSKSSILNKGVFLHELVHVYQYASGVNVFASGVALQMTKLAGEDPYNYGKIDYNTKWENINIEQQAALVEDMFRMQNGELARNGPYSNFLSDIRRVLPFSEDSDPIVGKNYYVPLPPPRPPEFGGISRCFLAGTPILMANGTHKPIEQIRPGDRVMAFDPAADGGRGAHVPRPVTQTFTNEAQQIVDLRGLRCTPGHVFLTGETDHLGRGVFKTIASILKEDGTLVEQDGSVVRARTGAKLGSIEDTPVHVAYRDPETGAEPVVLVRAGVPAITVHRLPERGGWEHQSWSLAQWSARHGVDVLLDGTLRAADGTLYGASDWPKGPTPLDARETQNWVVRTADGQPYTPPWIAELSEVDEHASLRVVGEGARPSGSRVNLIG